MSPARGEVWFADLSPTQGHEQDGVRPVLIVSGTTGELARSHLVLAVPFTRTVSKFPTNVRVKAPEGGLHSPSYLLCGQLRALSKRRLRSKLGEVRPGTLDQVHLALHKVLFLCCRDLTRVDPDRMLIGLPDG